MSSISSANGTVAQLLREQAGTSPERIALRFEGRTWTYGAMWTEANRAASLLRDAGVNRGARVATNLDNCPELVFLLLGCALAGAVLVPINTGLAEAGRSYILDHSEPVVCFDSREQLAEQIGRMPAEDAPAAHVNRGTPLTIIYTSGTTGRPKGVVLPQFSYCNTGRYFAAHLGATERDVFHTTLPLFHVNAQQASLMGALSVGGTLALGSRFSAASYWADVVETGATITNLIGAMMVILARAEPDPAERRHSLRYLVSAPVPAQHFDEIPERFGAPAIEGYGLTETATLCLLNPIQSPRKGSCGRPMSYTEVALSDEGEILARPRLPDAFMREYYRDPEATAEAWQAGWFRTGDRGRVDDDGYFYFIDRIKDIIRRRGENISSVEVERAALAHGAVAQCAAVGVPSELGEEDVKLFVVCNPGTTVAATELIEFVAQRVPAFARPTAVEFRDALPMTETQRVKKHELKTQTVAFSGEAT